MIMKLIKLTETHYIIVDDSEIKEGDYFYSIRNLIEKAIINYSIGEHIGKITHSTQPLEDYTRGDGKTIKVYVEIEQLHLYKIKELIGEVDVEKNVKKHLDEHHNNEDIAHPELYDEYNSFIKGYNQALEDNKEKKYTENDLKKAIITTRRKVRIFDCIDVEKIIQSFQPKTEWNVEIVDGKLKLKQ